MFSKKHENESKAGEEKAERICSKNDKKVIIIISVIVIIFVIIACAIINNIKSKPINKKGEGNAQGFEQTSSNNNENRAALLSFRNMNVDDEKFNETQQAILKYFEDYNEYLYTEPEVLKRYPQLFKQAKIILVGGVVKTLKSTNEEFEVLVYEDEFGYQFGPFPTEKYTLDGPSGRLCIIKGEQLEERLIEDDWIAIAGRYVGVETRTIDGISYTLPVINAIKIKNNDWSNPNSSNKDDTKTIRTVAKYIFGEDIKISKGESADYLVTLDNQSNANFKAFNMNWGTITYNKEYNNLSDNIIKQIFCSADFNHFIVTTYDKALKYLYIEYFDKSFNKLWSREFEYNSNDMDNISPFDYNEKQMAVVIDNDLYLINLDNGENVIEPVLVGFKTKVIMMSDGIILIGAENKDLVVKVDFKGNIVYRINGDTNLTSISYVQTQIVDGKLILYVNGENENADEENPTERDIKKYMVIKNDGTVEYSTKDLSSYKG